jgi:hypothetical protein
MQDFEKSLNDHVDRAEKAFLRQREEVDREFQKEEPQGGYLDIQRLTCLQVNFGGGKGYDILFDQDGGAVRGYYRYREDASLPLEVFPIAYQEELKQIVAVYGLYVEPEKG